LRIATRGVGMPERKPSALQVAAEIRRVLQEGGSAEHAKGVQWFFKEEIRSHGWYTGELRKAAVRLRRAMEKERGLDFVVHVADKLFAGKILEEKIFGVFLLENQTRLLSDKEFRLFTSWLDRVSSWADHDALAHDLLAPMVKAKPARRREVFRWAKSKNRWRRRAACVALIRGVREKKFFPEVTRLSEMLLSDQDDMVQKGMGWLLRETTKFDAKRAVPYLMKIRGRAPRLVLRTACETLTKAERRRVLNP
jgi:3-methyladenine DNA glycosylase AlkD